MSACSREHRKGSERWALLPTLRYGGDHRQLRRQGPGEPGTASWLGQALQALGVDHDVKEYPGAGHAFLNDHDSAGEPNPVIFIVMGKFAGPSGYHERSAHDARRRILAFFCAHLK
jgi:carboxymethylenebutenolidase